tara:strand:+ start:34 stop:867 length:834 start_codon:yes stop_codon:yes gene_type:complete
MAFKQDRDSGSKLDSYSSMQDKGLIGKIKDKVTAKRRDNSYKREAEVKALKDKRDAIINKSFEKPSYRIEIKDVEVASKDDMKKTTKGEISKPVKQKMQVKSEVIPHGGGQKEVSYAPYDPPKEKVKLKVKLKDKAQETQDKLTQYQKMRDEIRSYSFSDRRNTQWKSKKGKLGKKDKIKNKYGFGGTYEGTSSGSGGSRGAGEGGGVYSGPSDMSRPSGKSRAFAIGGVGVVVGSWLASQGKSLLSGKPARNVKTTYSMTNPTQETLRSGKGKIGK